MTVIGFVGFQVACADTPEATTHKSTRIVSAPRANCFMA
jgi:hypothetical protein